MHPRSYQSAMLPPRRLRASTAPCNIAMDPPIAIVGGGLAGVACSVGLTRHGIAHKIYEAAGCFGEVGAGIAIGPDVLQALQAIDPRLRECFESCATRNRGEAKSKSWLSFRYGMAMAPSSAADVVLDGSIRFGSVILDVQAEGPSEYGLSCVHRQELLKKFARLIPEGTAEFGKQLVGVEDDGTAVKLTFTDGAVAWASAVLGCDGIMSVTRRAVLLPDPASIRPAFAGEYCYRNLIPLHEAQRILGDEMATNGNIFCGYDGYVTTYPVANRGEEWVNIVAVRRESKSDLPDTEVWQKPGTKESMVQDFEGWGAPILQLLDTFKEPRKWPLFDSRAARTYTRGRLCLLGDAAHASTPHQGAGAAMAVEDACSMTYLLSKASGSQDITNAFRAFDDFRRPRTQRLASTSRVADQIFELTHKGAMDNIDSIREDLRLRHPWTRDSDILNEVKRVYRQWKAISAAQQLLPSIWEEQSIDVTSQEVPSDGDSLDSETCSDDENTDEEFELLSECRCI